MPTFKITSPDGAVYRVNGPDGATVDDAIAYVQQNRETLDKVPRPSGPTNTGQAGASAALSRTDRVLQGMRDPIDGGAQLLTKMLPEGLVRSGNRLNNWLADNTGLVGRLPEGGVDQQVRDQEQAYQRRRMATGESGLDGYRTLGNIASPANLAVSSRLPIGSALGGKIAAGALGGGASGLTNPVTEGSDFWGEKGKQVGTGAAFGAAAPRLVAGVARVVSPKASVNPQLALLRNEGVQPTIGQTLGGWANRLEEKATSIPLVGDAIAVARAKAQGQFNSAAINRATAPIGQKVEGSGTEAVNQAHNLIGDAYDAAKSQLGAFRIDTQANSELSRLRMMAGAGLEGRERKAFNSYFNDYIVGNRGFTADKFKELDSKLTSDIGRFGQGDAYQQKLGDALKELQGILFGSARRANPSAASALDAADRAYANLVRVEGASVAAKGADGVFTPGQLMTAVRSADKSVRDNATARGKALMQDLAGAGTAVLGSRVPDSGTAGRVMTAGLGAAAVSNPMLAGAGIGGGLLMYSPQAQSLLRNAVASRPAAAGLLSQSLRDNSSLLTPSFSQVGMGLLDY